jgi:nucleoside-diphosphate kinase
MNRKPHQERALVILKPDAVQRSLMGEIIGRFERVGLKFVACKFMIPTEEQLIEHYNKDDAWCLEKGERTINDLKESGLPVEKEALEYGRDIVRSIIKVMQESPVMAMVVEGNQATTVARKLAGATEPRTSDVGTIRGDFTIDSYGHAMYENRSVRNLVHCSDEPAEAEREIKVWFKDEEIMDYVTAQERIMYDVNFDGKKD